MLSAVTLMPPNVLDQLGSKANGMYLLTQQAPPSDEDNTGVQQMLKELKDAGFKADGDDAEPREHRGLVERARPRRHPGEASEVEIATLDLEPARRRR